MNPASILQLISTLLDQVQQLTQDNATLHAQVMEAQATPPVPDPNPTYSSLSQP